jgi:hypothetical protein
MYLEHDDVPEMYELLDVGILHGKAGKARLSCGVRDLQVVCKGCQRSASGTQVMSEISNIFNLTSPTDKYLPKTVLVR